MAQLVFSRVGAAVGKAALPKGIQILGAKVSGAALGRAAGSLVAGSLFAPVRDGPRIQSLALMESREGAGIPNPYGRMRVAGQVIWAARFKENSRERRVGRKTGPKVRDFSYSVSFAVALCEGETTRIGEVWANGEPMDLTGVTWRFYNGSETQLPDALIETIEGAKQAPAYRGVCYVVFEDLPLADYGNRLPQLSFEVFRSPVDEGGTGAVRSLIKGVNIIPASGEFAYDTEIVSTRRFPGIQSPQNLNARRGEADFNVSMDQLHSDLPEVTRAALTVGWFGDDLRAGACKIRPGVERTDKTTIPENWRAGGVGRGGAYSISKDSDGRSNYGGTPSDASIIRALRDLSARGIQPVVTPFLFMDVPEGNGLSDPYGGSEQAPFPWRGRITGSAGDVAAFLGGAQLSDFQIAGDEVVYSGDTNDWGYRRFIFHLVHLAKVAGGVEAFLLGSEMVALSRVRASDGSFPFVDGLIALAADVKSLLGAGVKVSYAADWTEYGAYVDGADISFPLDDFWASGDIDFVGVDWYPPMADWREGATHADALAGFDGLEDAAYLTSNIAGGEGYDWYYASASDRDAQIRSPIIDTAHGEHWVFRQKDLLSWWNSAHHARPSGVRDAASTAWVPGSKPIRLMEIGFPAIDKGANAPNLFFDPKSSESGLPPYSNGARDDLQQRRALEVTLSFWQTEPAIEAAYVWCWDARPFPAFPSLGEVWSDGANWQFGHWLNGRVGASELGAVVKDICARGGVSVDTSQLNGLVEGYALSGVSSVRGALEALRLTHGFQLIEQAGELVFTFAESGSQISVEQDDMVGQGAVIRRGLLDKRPGAVRLTYISSGGTYEPAISEARDENGDRGNTVEVSLPVVLDEMRASDIANYLLRRAGSADSADIVLSLNHLGIEPGDTVSFGTGNEEWTVAEIEDEGIARALTIERLQPPPSILRGLTPGTGLSEVEHFGVPELLIIDAIGGAPLVAGAGAPWPGEVRVFAGARSDALTERAVLEVPALMGLVLEGAAANSIGRWDHASELLIELPIGEFSSAPASSVLSGANRMLVETSEGWELIGFERAELVGAARYRISNLLRGLRGTTPSEVSAGAKFAVLDDAVLSARVSADEIGVKLDWRADARGHLGDTQSVQFEARGVLPYRPGHLRASWIGSDLRVSWTRRGIDAPESWALPESENTGEFQISFWDAETVISAQTISSPEFLGSPPPGAVQIRVAEIGSDGRLGADTVLPIPPALP